jgi:hypothetical protein
MGGHPVTCVLCARRRPDIGHLCAPCHDRLAQQLLDIQTEAETLSAVPSMAQPTGTRGGTLASHRSPARLDVLVLTDPRTAADEHGTLGLLGVLASWARAVRDDRHLAWPDQITVASERKTLSAHLVWLSEQPYVDEFAAEIGGLLRQLQRANGSGERRPKPVGICPTLYDDGECGGSLWLDDTRRDVTCGACGRVFAPDELRHLGDILVNQGYVEVFRAEWFTGVPASTIRRWVAEGRCTSEKDGRRLMVQVSEVQQLRDRNTRRVSVAI